MLTQRAGSGLFGQLARHRNTGGASGRDQRDIRPDLLQQGSLHHKDAARMDRR